MKIKMLQTKKASENGIDVICFEKDKVYTVSKKLYDIFKKQKWAEDYKEPVKEIVEEKKIEVIENKAMTKKNYNNKRIG